MDRMSLNRKRIPSRSSWLLIQRKMSRKIISITSKLLRNLQSNNKSKMINRKRKVKLRVKMRHKMISKAIRKMKKNKKAQMMMLKYVWYAGWEMICVYMITLCFNLLGNSKARWVTVKSCLYIVLTQDTIKKR